MVFRAFPGITMADVRRMNMREMTRWWDRAREALEGPEPERDVVHGQD